MGIILLKDAKAGKRYIVKHIFADAELQKSGIAPKAVLYMCDRAMFGDPFWIMANGKYITLKESEASAIFVEELS